MQMILDDQYSNWFYLDVMTRGKYPAYMERYFEQQGIHIDWQPGDAEILKNNSIDFVAFSYYFSQVSTTEQGWEKTSGNLIMANKNPYLENQRVGLAEGSGGVACHPESGVRPLPAARIYCREWSGRCG